MVTSRPFLAKMPASLASVSGAKPVQPEVPMATLVPCASAGAPAKQATSAAATILIDVMFRSIPDVLPQHFCMIHATTAIPASQIRAPKYVVASRMCSAAAQAKRAAPLERPLTFCALPVGVGQLYPT